jgi:hypothetical protein
MNVSEQRLLPPSDAAKYWLFNLEGSEADDVDWYSLASPELLSYREVVPDKDKQNRSPSFVLDLLALGYGVIGARLVVVAKRMPDPPTVLKLRRQNTECLLKLRWKGEVIATELTARQAAKFVKETLKLNVSRAKLTKVSKGRGQLVAGLEVQQDCYASQWPRYVLPPVVSPL